jgi:hypothetical protein
LPAVFTPAIRCFDPQLILLAPALSQLPLPQMLASAESVPPATMV